MAYALYSGLDGRGNVGWIGAVIIGALGIGLALAFLVHRRREARRVVERDARHRPPAPPALPQPLPPRPPGGVMVFPSVGAPASSDTPRTQHPAPPRTRQATPPPVPALAMRPRRSTPPPVPPNALRRRPT